MFIARRTFRVVTKTGEEKPVEVRISAPVEENRDWRCSYEIDLPEDGWPAQTVSSSATGIDAIAALQSALHKLAIDLHTSSYHRDGRMYWLEPGAGYGIMVHRSARDLLKGDDITYYG